MLLLLDNVLHMHVVAVEIVEVREVSAIHVRKLLLDQIGALFLHAENIAIDCWRQVVESCGVWHPKLHRFLQCCLNILVVTEALPLSIH